MGPNELFDCVLSIISDKEKNVRIEGKSQIEAIFRTLGQQYLSAKANSMKPMIQEKILGIMKRIFPKEISSPKEQNLKRLPPPQFQLNQKSELEEAPTSFFKSIVNFTEPRDSEISYLHKILQEVIGDQVKKIFSFESETILNTFS